jgi:hypothetical protein
MSHERRKKGGARKDKKLQHMRDAVEQRKAAAPPKDFGKDKPDIVTYKTGSQGDRNQDPSAFKGGIGPTGKR